MSDLYDNTKIDIFIKTSRYILGLDVTQCKNIMYLYTNILLIENLVYVFTIIIILYAYML